MARKQQTPPQTSTPKRHKKERKGSVEVDASAESTTDAKDPDAAIETSDKPKAVTRNTPSPKISSFNLEVGRITAMLMTERVREVRKLGLPSEISDPSWDREFAGAMKRAELIIRKITHRDYDIHAYQVFPETAKFTEEQISKEFSRLGWKKISSKKKTMILMSELRAKFQDVIENLGGFTESSSVLAQEASDSIRNGLDEIWKSSAAVRSIHPRFQDEATSLLEKLNEAFFSRSRIETWEETEYLTYLYEWCFPFENHGNQPVRRYRPHELFRFAAIQGWFSDKLIQTLSTLSPEFLPYPPKDLNFRIPIGSDHSSQFGSDSRILGTPIEFRSDGE